MNKTLQIVLIYILTLVVGTPIAVTVTGMVDMGVGPLLLVLGWAAQLSIPALLISLAAAYLLRSQAPLTFFRSMMRVLLGVLVLTFVMLVAMNLQDAEIIRAFAIYGAVAVSLTFWRLKPA